MAQEKSTYAVFCEMLRHESAKPLVARLRNFVERFESGLSRYDAADKVHQFLTKTEQWMFSEIIVFAAEADEEGMLNASEGLEKMILCRLYPKIFEMDPSDAEEDVKLRRHIDGLAWVELEHLSLPSFELSLWPRLIKELRRMDEYKAPCDKLTCVVNACHVINDVLKRTQAETGASRPLSADDFLPLLIYACIKANPHRFHSNVEFIAAFRHPSRLNGEHSYWITMLMSAKEFIKQAGPATLDVSAEEYAKLYAASLKAAECKDTLASSEESDGAQQDLLDLSATGDSTKQNESSADQSSAVDNKQQPEAEECILLEQESVLVYQIPAAALGDHRAAEWQKIIWEGPCKVFGKGLDMAIKMFDKNNGRLFAECLILADQYDDYVRPTDSHQHFVLKITNGQKHALVGLSFTKVDDASKFHSVLHTFRDSVAKRLAESQQFKESPQSSVDSVLTTISNSHSSSSTSNVEPNAMKLPSSVLQPVEMQPQNSTHKSASEQIPLGKASQPAVPQDDPFAALAGFVDMSLMNVPDVHNTNAHIPVTA